MGAWCHTAITAITAQTPLEVNNVFPLPATVLLAQLETLFSLGPKFSPQVLKTGMLGSAEQVAILAELLRIHRRPLVVDTVFRATSGASLAGSVLPAIMCEQLAPIASLFTPNLPESALLLQCEPATSEEQMYEQLDALMALGLPAVLLKGGHLPGDEVVDLLATQSGIHKFSSPKILSSHTHGSGCALATAIAVGLAQQLDLVAAVAQAREYVRKFILSASRYQFVEQNGPLVHF